jgi:transcriptional regulator with XRE-family HTH domain
VQGPEPRALLANLSTTYYTFLEQGRPVRPSAEVLDALASALRMSAAERRYLQVLAHGRDGAASADVVRAAPPERIDRGVIDLVQRLDPFPTFVKGRRWDVLTSNPVARELFTDWEALPAGERNLVRWMFMAEHAREVYQEWEPEAEAMLGRFRLTAARYPHDPDFEALIAELRRDSQHVRDWWPRHDVRAVGSGVKKCATQGSGRSTISRRAADSRQSRPDARHLLPSERLAIAAPAGGAGSSCPGPCGLHRDPRTG